MILLEILRILDCKICEKGFLEIFRTYGSFAKFCDVFLRILSLKDLLNCALFRGKIFASLLVYS